MTLSSEQLLLITSTHALIMLEPQERKNKGMVYVCERYNQMIIKTEKQFWKKSVTKEVSGKEQCHHRKLTSEPNQS